jgi:hypothetical protein
MRFPTHRLGDATLPHSVLWDDDDLSYYIMVGLVEEAISFHLLCRDIIFSCGPINQAFNDWPKAFDDF